MTALRHASFAAVVDDNTRVLILGSLPGAASLAARRYYAHPRNQFWALAGGAIGVDLVTLDYDARLAALLSGGIGLWDVVGSAARKGSLDTAIRDAVANSFTDLAATLPRLAAIAFNGSKAAQLGARALASQPAIPQICLPSSSPAYCAIGLDEKQQRWNILRNYLDSYAT